MRRWDRLFEKYMEVYTARGVSPVTIDRVGRELERFGAWLKRRRPRPRLEQVDLQLIQQYIQERTAFRSKGTTAGVIGVLRGLGEFLVQEGYWATSPLRWMRGPKLDSRSRIPRRIPAKALQQLWRQAACHPLEYHRQLWLSILSILYGTGLRRGELERLNVKDWRREEGLLVIDGRKTGQPRHVPIPPMTQRCLDTYLPQRQNHLEQKGIMDESAMFVNKWGRRLVANSISVGIRRLATRSGVGRVTLHQFRHTCASDLLEQGIGLPEVKGYLGHKAISTTIRYLHIADPQRQEAVRRHPINALLTTGEES